MSRESHPSFHFLRKRLPSFAVLSGLRLTDGRHNPDNLIGLLSYPTVWDSLRVLRRFCFPGKGFRFGAVRDFSRPCDSLCISSGPFRKSISEPLRQSTLCCWRISLLPCRSSSPQIRILRLVVVLVLL